MIEINFIYKGNNHIIKCEKESKLKERCDNFIKENSLNEDNIFFLYNNKKINLNSNLFIEEQFCLENIENVEKQIRVDLVVSEYKKQIISKDNLINDIDINDDLKQKILLKDDENIINKILLDNSYSI